MAAKRSYNHYRDLFKGHEFPYAFIDLDLLDENIREIPKRAGNKTIRIASKSIRVKEVLHRILDADPVYQGIMSYSPEEALWLSHEGFDDLLIGYPNWHNAPVERICEELNKGKTIIFMVDLPDHIRHLNAIGKKMNTVIPVCLDVDMTSLFPGVRFGVWRSSVNDVEGAMKVYDVIEQSDFVRLDGVMGYEAAIAGMGDNFPGKALQNMAVKFFKSRSAKEIAKRRGAVVQALKDRGAELKLVNGGGTGSMEWTRQEEAVTEITVGSGFFNSGLFDNYTNFKHNPSLAYAVEIVRQPEKNIYTCHGGGYQASGAVGSDKTPVPYLPEGAKLLDQEGAGEVQTPVMYKGNEKLNLGDPIFLRHAKAGELSERFKEFYLIKEDKIIGATPTYRGEGQCFL